MASAKLIARTIQCFRIVLVAIMPGLCAATEQSVADNISWGRDLVFSRDKGNCLACHEVVGGTQMGNIAPPLADMKRRFPDRAGLRRQIWDAGDANLHTMMPPYGRHQILSEQELDAVVEFLYTR